MKLRNVACQNDVPFQKGCGRCDCKTGQYASRIRGDHHIKTLTIKQSSRLAKWGTLMCKVSVTCEELHYNEDETWSVLMELFR